MKMKKSLVVLFCVLVLTMGLYAGEEMKGMKNCEKFDDFIETAFAQYNRYGIQVELLTAVGEKINVPPYFYGKVTLRVAPLVPDPKKFEADTWYFFGVLHHITGEVPCCIRVIDKDKLIGCCKAAKQLPKDFVWETVDLFFPLHYKIETPSYRFCNADKTKCIDIAAYK